MKDNYFEWEKVYSIPISALQHYVYCSRQFALIHIEEIYEENLFTIEGNFVHERVDEVKSYYNKDKNCENNLPVWSDELGIYGVVDVVEFNEGIPFPVEFKRGKKKNKMADNIQLMAQGFCLEEMFNQKLGEGAIYYNKSRRRRKVVFTKNLRNKLKEVVNSVREMLLTKIVPSPANDNRCHNCSLKRSCLPNINDKIEKVKKSYYERGNNGTKN